MLNKSIISGYPTSDFSVIIKFSLSNITLSSFIIRVLPIKSLFSLQYSSLTKPANGVAKTSPTTHSPIKSDISAVVQSACVSGSSINISSLFSSNAFDNDLSVSDLIFFVF